VEQAPPAAMAGLQHLSTSLRTRVLADTLATATALMPRLGITDCIDVTADDVLGVPVWFSFRPGSPANAVRAGKGLWPTEAQVGALMEAIEYVAAERADQRDTFGHRSLAEMLQPFGGAVTVADLAPRLGAVLPPARVLPADRCEDVVSGAVHWMPAELLRLLDPPAEPDGPLFGTSSNGLASGNSLDEATLHALLEVLERDALALDHVRPSRCWLSAASLPPPFDEWCARWQALGVQLRVRVLPSDFGLPCLEAELVSLLPGGLPRATGYGLHLDPAVALARAVTEAAQGRLHDLRFGRSRAPGPPEAPREPRADDAELPFTALPRWACIGVAAALSMLLDTLRARGLPCVLRRRLNADAAAADLDGLHVVKLLVPGCETAVGQQVRIGRRLARRLLQAA